MNTTARNAVLAGAAAITAVLAGAATWLGTTRLDAGDVAAIAAAGGAGVAGAFWGIRAYRRERALERALQRRDEQLAQTAHELRTPLTAIVQAIEIVQLGFAEDPEERRQFLEEADQAAHHLSFLVHDILDGAALDAGKLRLEVGSHLVDDVLRAAQRVLGMQTSAHMLSIDVPVEVRRLRIRADVRRVLQVLFNLVGNAVRYTEPGARVELAATAADGAVRFAVRDEGDGVPDHVRPLLFEAFAGDDNRARADGTGLGLHICRALVARMGGTIGYRPQEPSGSEFWFTLPVGAEATVASADTAAQ